MTMTGMRSKGGGPTSEATIRQLVEALWIKINAGVIGSCINFGVIDSVDIKRVKVGIAGKLLAGGEDENAVKEIEEPEVVAANANKISIPPVIKSILKLPQRS